LAGNATHYKKSDILDPEIPFALLGFSRLSLYYSVLTFITGGRIMKVEKQAFSGH
jgi:hypothetical protein